MWFWAPDQESADSSHGWLLCPYGQYPASNARKHYQATTALLCQKFDLVFCDCAWWCSSRLWIIYSIFSLSPGSSSGKHGMRVSWEAATVLWNQEVKLNPVSTVVHWWTCAPWMPPVLLSLSFKRVVPSWKKYFMRAICSFWKILYYYVNDQTSHRYFLQLSWLWSDQKCFSCFVPLHLVFYCSAKHSETTPNR